MMVRKASVIVGITLGCSVAVSAQQGPPPTSGLGYPSVQAALDGMRAKSGGKVSVQDGWTIIQDPQDGSHWSFTSAGHFAHPAVGRRSLVQEGGRFFVRTEIQCEATKPACDRLRADYQRLDEQMMKHIQEQQQRGRPGACDRS